MSPTLALALSAGIFTASAAPRRAARPHRPPPRRRRRQPAAARTAQPHAGDASAQPPQPHAPRAAGDAAASPQPRAAQPPARTPQARRTRRGGLARARARMGGLPPPPVPAVLPPVPNIAPGFSAPVNAVPERRAGRRAAAAVRRPRAARRDRDGAAAQHRSRARAVEPPHRELPDRRRARRVRRALPARAAVLAQRVARDQLVPGRPRRRPGHAGHRRRDRRAHRRDPARRQYRIGVSGTRITNDSTVNSYDPFYETALQLSVTQPLGRGRAIDQTRLQLQLARTQRDDPERRRAARRPRTPSCRSRTRTTISSPPGATSRSKKKACATRRRRRASNARLAARGAVAQTDIVEANTQVNVFQDNVFAALQNVQRLQTQIKSLILANPADPVWIANLVPTTRGRADSARALARRADRLGDREPAGDRAAARAARERESNLAFARDQLRPQIDLGLNYTSNGFAGVPTDPNANPIFGLFGAQIAAINALIARSNARTPAAADPAGHRTGFGALPAYQNGALRAVVPEPDRQPLPDLQRAADATAPDRQPHRQGELRDRPGAERQVADAGDRAAAAHARRSGQRDPGLARGAVPA